MSRIEAPFRPKANPYEGPTVRWSMNPRPHGIVRACLLGLLMLAAPLSGCIGEGELLEEVDLTTALTIDGTSPENAVFRAGEWLSLIHI